MAINIHTETVLTLTQATKHLPPRRRGRRPTPQTLYRWARGGLRGQRLETIRVGGTLCTSLQALQRFAERLSATDRPIPSQEECRTRPDVERELDRHGF